MNRRWIPLIFVLGSGILIAGVNALALQGLSPCASFTRAVDDQRNAVAKPEVRDAAEEQVEQEDVAKPAAGPALVDTIPPLAVRHWSFVPDAAASLPAGRPRGRAGFIRGPPRHG